MKKLKLDMKNPEVVVLEGTEYTMITETFNKGANICFHCIHVAKKLAAGKSAGVACDDCIGSACDKCLQVCDSCEKVLCPTCKDKHNQGECL